jgi:hypothetical protein
MLRSTPWWNDNLADIWLDKAITEVPSHKWGDGSGNGCGGGNGDGNGMLEDVVYGTGGDGEGAGHTAVSAQYGYAGNGLGIGYLIEEDDEV